MPASPFWLYNIYFFSSFFVCVLDARLTFRQDIVILFCSSASYLFFFFFSFFKRNKLHEKGRTQNIMCCVCHEYTVFTVALSHHRNDLYTLVRCSYNVNLKKKKRKRTYTWKPRKMSWIHCVHRWTAYITSEHTCVYKIIGCLYIDRIDLLVFNLCTRNKERETNRKSKVLNCRFAGNFV